MCFYSPHQKKAQNHQANLNQNKTSPHCFGPAKERVSFPCGHCSKASSCLPESPAGSHNCSLPRSAPQVGFLLFKSPSVMPGARAGHRAQLGLKCHLQSHARAHTRTRARTRTPASLPAPASVWRHTPPPTLQTSSWRSLHAHTCSFLPQFIALLPPS